MREKTNAGKLLVLVLYSMICSLLIPVYVYAAGGTLEAPANFRQIGDTESKMIITWDKVEGAAGYGVSLYSDGWQEPIVVTDNYYIIEGNVWNSVRVCSIDANGNKSAYTSYILALTSPVGEYFCQTKCTANSITFDYYMGGKVK